MEELEPDKVDTTEERDPGTALLSDTGITNFTKAEQIMIGWLVGRDQIAREFVSNQLEEWFQALCERYPADTRKFRLIRIEYILFTIKFLIIKATSNSNPS